MLKEEKNHKVSGAPSSSPLLLPTSNLPFFDLLCLIIPLPSPGGACCLLQQPTAASCEEIIYRSIRILRLVRQQGSS